ncbi:hypothetical protein NDN08_002825 [Rhodosorus marinus]|uniref:RNA helicase n=1 Tax=Rhodosorus marinus TaxID=101924 RepID=A0AAV8UYB0_9RHOD|nr:hypothetical protein NDN08_002825 [Rhodosorus marinus]
MGKRRGRTGAGGAVVSSASALRGGVVRGGDEDKRKETGGGGWLGKTPKGLLSECCQRDKRLRPVYRNLPDGKVKCLIPRGKRGEPKGAKGEWEPVFGEGADEELAALTVLAKLERGKPLHRLMAPEYRTTWAELGSTFAKAEKAAEERDTRKKEIDKKKVAREKQNTKLAEVRLSEKSRLAIEDAALQLGASQHHVEPDEEISSRAFENTVRRLTFLGFARTDVEVAAARVPGCNYDAALDWLCMNLDEAELPKAYKPHADLEVVRDGIYVDAGRARELSKRYASSKLAAERALRDNGSDLPAAVISLFKSVVGPFEDYESPSVVSEGQLANLRQEEAEALKAIYDDQISFGTDDDGLFFVCIDGLRDLPAVSGKVRICFRDVLGSYPYALPVVDVSGENTSAATRRALMRGLVSEAERSRAAWAELELSHPEPILMNLISYLHHSDLEKIVDDAGLIARRRHLVSKRADDEIASAVGKVGIQSPAHDGRKASQRTRATQKRVTRKRQTFASNPSAEIMAKRRSLPAWKHQTSVIEDLSENQVLVVSGATGSGKTTQVPQFILDSYEVDDPNVFIMVTQPRRLAAASVAERVALERNQKVGQDVGYQVRLDSKIGPNTRLAFCTTGILLRRLQGDPGIRDITHVVVDEVHERSIETDILLLLLREVLASRKDLKVVLMSATLDAERFASYFKEKLNRSIPIISISGRTFPVTEFYLEEALRTAEFKLRDGDVGTKRGVRKNNDEVVSEDPFQRTLNIIDEGFVNLDLIKRLVFAIDKQAEEKDGSILVFLPGIADIMALVSRLSDSNCLWPVPLHALLSPADSQKAFSRPPRGLRKVVCSTNVAETSVTVEDVVYVVDSIRAKISGFDELSQSFTLDEQFISKASAKQRAGRAGRVRPGICFRLVKKATFEGLRNMDVPELLRTSLDRCCLTVMSALNRDPGEVLALAVDPPSPDAVESSLRNLTDLGSISRSSPKGRELTALGAHLAVLPMDVRLGKLLIYSSLLGCVDPCLAIVSAGLVRQPFSDPSRKRAFNWGKSDLLAYSKVHEAFRSAKNAKAFCEANSVSRRTMNTISEGVKQFEQALSDAGFSTRSNDSSSVTQIVKAVVCAALYPHVVRVDSPEQVYREVAGGKVVDNSRRLPRELKLRLRDGQRVFLDKGSVNFEENVLETGWLVYNEKIRRGGPGKEGKDFLRDSTMVSPFALLLFGGDIRIHHDRGIITVDDWIQFRAPAKVGVLVRTLRKQLDDLLWQKFADPNMNLTDHPVLTNVRRLIISEN